MLFALLDGFVLRFGNLLRDEVRDKESLEYLGDFDDGCCFCNLVGGAGEMEEAEDAAEVEEANEVKDVKDAAERMEEDMVWSWWRG